MMMMTMKTLILYLTQRLNSLKMMMILMMIHIGMTAMTTPLPVPVMTTNTLILKQPSS